VSSFAQRFRTHQAIGQDEAAETLFVFEMAPGPCAYKRNFFSDRLGILSGMIGRSRVGAGEAFLITAGIAAQTHGRA
jgi:hypothetical protein